MRRIGFVGLSTAAFALATFLALPSTAVAGVCGDGHKDTGEQCDLGTGTGGNGQGCCSATCTNVATGEPCIANVTGSDTCHEGLCLSNNVCDTSGGLIDPCTLGSTCKVCVNLGPGRTDHSCTTGSFASAGTTCNFDSDKCTIDTCNGSGTCGSTPKVCPQPTNVCQRGNCRQSDGACINQNASSGTPCNDGNPCTQGEQCSGSGANCNQGIVNVSANTPCDDKNGCTTGEKCNGSGTCNGGTNVASGTACDDGNSCTSNTTCNGSGGCTNPTFAANGTACNAGNTCRGNSTCLTIGNPAIASICQNGTAINDGAACTNGDPCNTGFCSSGNCIKRDPTQISGTVEDYNSCTDPTSTSCTATGMVSGTSCEPNTESCDLCPPGSVPCQSDPNLSNGGAKVPCGCSFTQ
jgi:hypothetical protein